MALRKAGVSQFDINRYVQIIHEERRRCSNPYDNPSARAAIKVGEKIYKEYLREQAKIERALESSGYFWKLVESGKI